MESPIPIQHPAELHCGCIMDGCVRWAQSHSRPVADGFDEGAAAMGRVVQAATRLGVRSLTLASAECDRQSGSGDHVRSMLAAFLDREAAHCARQGIRIVFTGGRDITESLGTGITSAERSTARGHAMLLRIDTAGSSRGTILSAAVRVRDASDLARRRFAVAVTGQPRVLPPPGDIDVLIRTGGERRLDDRLLWESAYAEIVFTDTLWPDFGERDLARAMSRWNGTVPPRPVRDRPLAALTAGLAHTAARDDRWLR